MEKEFDIIIAGAGLAGLSLAYRFAIDPFFDDQSILLIDKEMKTKNDRTWCFWGMAPKLFEEVISYQWKKISFVSDKYADIYELKPGAYHQVRGVDFYNFVLEKINKAGNIQFEQAEISDISEVGERVRVKTEKNVFDSAYLFDSRFDEQWIREKTRKHTLLLQHFRGWVIKTPQAIFKTDEARMFDFRLPQENEVRFVYVLPYSETEALVEFTVFSKSLLPSEKYDESLKNYIQKYLEIADYEVLEEENGIIPMSDYPFAKAQSKRWINIGTRAGMAKPSSGYAFKRVQTDLDQVVQLIKEGKDLKKDRKGYDRFLLYDAMMLDIMKRDGGRIKDIFTDLFSSNPIHKVLGFLDEETGFDEDIKIMYSVPHLPFFVSAFRLGKRKVMGIG